MTARLSTRDLTLGYRDRTVVEHLTLDIPDGAFTAVVGPNACGKSTLLRALVRLLSPVSGGVTLDGRDLGDIPSRELARVVGFLPQDPISPEGITVRQLVGRGRFPYQTLLSRWSPEDERAVSAALEVAGVADLAERRVDQLSGGQRQRSWIAMVLAQDTGHLLLDEPTSFLDLTYQFQVLRLLASLRDEGRTVVAVLHDINQACRFADHIVAMRGGAVVAEGKPADVVDPALLAEVFDLECIVVPDPLTGTPMVVAAP